MKSRADLAAPICALCPRRANSLPGGAGVTVTVPESVRRQSGVASRCLGAAIALCLVACLERPCFGKGGKNECVVSYEGAQISRQSGDLLAAQAALVYCASTDCPEAMNEDCNRWLSEVQAALPSVVFRARTSTGLDVSDARISIDGNAEQPLNGRAIPINPGRHEVRVWAPGLLPVARRFQFLEGQKLRQESVNLTAELVSGSPKPGPALAPGDAPEPAPLEVRHVTVFQWLGAGVAAAGAAGFVYFGVEARHGEDNLDRCRPFCPKSQVSDVKRDYWLADLSLGTGIAALAAATVQYFAQGSRSTPARASGAGERPKRMSGLLVDVGAGLVSVRGSF